MTHVGRRRGERRWRTALRARHAADHAAAVLLAEVERDKLYRAFGHGSTIAYAIHELQLPARRAGALLQLGRMADSLPAIDAAFAAGELPYTKARELLRVVTPETERAWVERAGEVDSRTLERLVSGARRGEAPGGDDAKKGPARVRLVFEVDAHEASLIRDAIAAERVAAGVGRDELGDGALLALAMQRALHAATNDGVITAERFRTVLTCCPDCGRVDGHDHEVTETVADVACCDAEVVDLRPGPDRGALTRTIPPKVRRAVLHRDHERCVVPRRTSRLVDVHHLKHREHGGRHVEENLVTLCPAHHHLVHDGLLAVDRIDGRTEVRGKTHVGRGGRRSRPGDFRPDGDDVPARPGRAGRESAHDRAEAGSPGRAGRGTAHERAEAG